MRRVGVFVCWSRMRDRRGMCMGDARRSCREVVQVFFLCFDLRRLCLTMYVCEDG